MNYYGAIYRVKVKSGVQTEPPFGEKGYGGNIITFFLSRDQDKKPTDKVIWEVVTVTHFYSKDIGKPSHGDTYIPISSTTKAATLDEIEEAVIDIMHSIKDRVKAPSFDCVNLFATSDKVREIVANSGVNWITCFEDENGHLSFATPIIA